MDSHGLKAAPLKFGLSGDVIFCIYITSQVAFHFVGVFFLSGFLESKTLLQGRRDDEKDEPRRLCITSLFEIE